MEAKADPGTHLHDCIRECIALAVEQDLPVNLIHNDKRYRVDPVGLVRAVISASIQAESIAAK